MFVIDIAGGDRVSVNIVKETLQEKEVVSMCDIVFAKDPLEEGDLVSLVGVAVACNEVDIE